MTNKDILKLINGVYDFLISLFVRRFLLPKELSSIIVKSGKNTHCKKISEWSHKWRVLGKFNKDYYRVYSHCIGEDVNIVPDDICHNIIEPILNPKRFISAYEDKCLFDKILKPAFGRIVTPTTFLRNMGGTYYDIDYNIVDKSDVDKIIANIEGDVQKILVKVSLDSSSGKNISFFQRNENNLFVDINSGKILSKEFLDRVFGVNFIIQEVLEQSDFMNQFCDTSVNTIRVAVYRSVNSDKSEVINSIVRIGRKGSLIDNAHAGGVFVGVDENGRISKYCCTQYGEHIGSFNGVDFSNNSFMIPNYEKVKIFSRMVTDALPHMHLIALDIMLDKKGEPVLVEYNLRAFSLWLFQFTNGSAFGKYTDEIIEYCRNHKNEASRVSVIY